MMYLYLFMAVFGFLMAVFAVNWVTRYSVPMALFGIAMLVYAAVMAIVPEGPRDPVMTTKESIVKKYEKTKNWLLDWRSE